MRRSLLLALVCLALLGPGRMRAQGVSPATQDSSSVGPDATTQPFKFNLTARDAPNDGGGYIDLEWTVFHRIPEPWKPSRAIGYSAP